MKQPPKKVTAAVKAKAKAKALFAPAKAAAVVPKAAAPTAGAADWGKGKRQVLCRAWRSGACKFGDDCTFIHVIDGKLTPTSAFPAGTKLNIAPQPGEMCKFADKPADCPYGDTCIFKHGPNDGRDLAKVLQGYRA